MTRRYRYLGDRATRGLRPELAGATCIAVLNDRGKCVCGRKRERMATPIPFRDVLLDIARRVA